MWSRYAGAGWIVQALVLVGLLSGCDAPAANTDASTNAVEPAERATVELAGPERLVLAFGDSLYAGYGLKPGESLADQLQADLRDGGVNATVVNAGVSGDTTAAGGSGGLLSRWTIWSVRRTWWCWGWAATTCCASWTRRRRGRT